MSNFDKDISGLGKTESVQTPEEKPIIQYEPSMSTVASLISANGIPPPSIESRNGDMAIEVSQTESSSNRTNNWSNIIKDIEKDIDKLKQTPNVLAGKETKEDIQNILASINDIDGDGIPDDFDKNPGETVANVAARINKIGRYAPTENNTIKIFSAAQNIMTSLNSLLNKVSAMSAASLSAQQSQKAPAQDILDGEDNLFSSKKVDKNNK
ncbi:MAG: hypothetical protein LBB16_01310 [Puniceicoccales bacterium]|jgi:hypothetical protein|nr:hypothetical protein [Puniceicoccales bacterium]